MRLHFAQPWEAVTPGCQLTRFDLGPVGALGLALCEGETDRWHGEVDCVLMRAIEFPDWHLCGPGEVPPQDEIPTRFYLDNTAIACRSEVSDSLSNLTAQTVRTIY